MYHKISSRGLAIRIMEVNCDDDGQFSISPRSDASALEFNERMRVAKKEFEEACGTDEALRLASDSAAYNRFLADEPLDLPDAGWKDEPDVILRRHKELVYLAEKQSVECERLRRHIVVINDQNKMMSTRIDLLENTIINLSMRNDYSFGKINEHIISLNKQLKERYERDSETLG